MSRYRDPSPGARRLADPMRSSTGTVFSSGFDPYYPPPRHSVSNFAAPRRYPPPLEAQPISTRTYKDQGGAATKSRTEYAIKPRRNTLDQDAAPPPRPLSIAAPQPAPRARPVVTSAVDRPRSPVKPTYSRDDADRFVMPASKPHRHHKRIFSADAEDVNRLGVNHRTDKDRLERGGYRSSGAGGHRGYPVQAPLVRYQGPTDYDDYSYTGPREQFDRDYAAARPRPRNDSYTRSDRPMSMANLDEFLPPAQPRRDPGPPPVSRGYEKVPRVDELRPNGRAGSDYSRSSDSRTSDTSRPADIPQRRLSKRGPVSLHQDRDEGYASYREGYDEPRDKQHRKDRYDDDRKLPSERHYDTKDRDDRRHHKSHDDQRDNRSGLSGGIAAAGLAAVGTAAAGLASNLTKDSRKKDYDPEEEAARRERKERRRREAADREYDGPSDDRERRAEKAKDRDIDRREEAPREKRRDRDGKDRSESSDDYDREHGHHRRRHRDRKGRAEEPEASVDLLKAPAVSRDTSRTRERDPEAYDSEVRREERHRRRRDRVLSDEEGYGETAAGTDDERPRDIPLVEPTSKQPEAAPKGILKPPREKFPEDPNAVREGVAPLKDAGKKGVPPGARWTKISRNLVNPAALEDAHERFEERPDYVIVLRVLSKEEIQKLAVKTQEIRGELYSIDFDDYD